MTWTNDSRDKVDEVGKIDDAVITFISTEGVLGLDDTEAVEVGDVTVALIDVVAVVAGLFVGEDLIDGVD